MNVALRYPAILLILLLASPLLPSCGGRHTPDTVHTARQSEREHRIEELLREYRKRIDELNAAAERASERARTGLRESVDDLRKKHRDAEARLRKLREATNTAWGDVNDELQESLNRLKEALDQARSAEQPPVPAGSSPENGATAPR